MMYRVGVIGAGPGVSALHLPTLAGLADRFRVVHIADSGSGRAAALAASSGARASSDAAAVIADEDVDVVAICTPPDTHAELILAAVAAGKRAVFCEKPLATTGEQADAVIAACAESGVLLVVGTNHLFDPSWSRVTHHLGLSGAPTRSVAVTLALAANDRYHRWVSDRAPAAPPRRAPLDLSDPDAAAGVVRQLIVGLAVHDLPLVRDLAPGLARIEHARAVPPIGFDLGMRSGGIPVRFSAVMVPSGADTLWRVRVVTDHERVDVDFPPPFVHAGSARVRVTDAVGRSTVFPPELLDGYVAEWQALARLLDGEGAMEYSELHADARYVVAVADAAAAAVRGARP